MLEFGNGGRELEPACLRRAPVAARGGASEAEGSCSVRSPVSVPLRQTPSTKFPSHAYDVWAQPHLPLARAHDLSQKLTAQKYPILYHQPVRYHKTHIRVKKHMF